MRLTRALTTNIKLALRNLVRDRTFGLISVIGLSVAMDCAILVLSRAIEGYRHVEYYTHGDSTYRVLKRSVGDSGVSIGDWVSGGSTVALRDFRRSNWPREPQPRCSWPSWGRWRCGLG